MTIHVGADRADAAKNALGDTERECELIGLTPLGIDQSDEFIKTLFVEFAMSAELRQINDLIRDAANDLHQPMTSDEIETRRRLVENQRAG